eukprot:1872017-Amphidinium_carterae.1
MASGSHVAVPHMARALSSMTCWSMLRGRIRRSAFCLRTEADDYSPNNNITLIIQDEEAKSVSTSHAQ